jgi:hypothetical protein
VGGCQQCRAGRQLLPERSDGGGSAPSPAFFLRFPLPVPTRAPRLLQVFVDKENAKPSMHTQGKTFGLTFWENYYIVGQVQRVPKHRLRKFAAAVNGAFGAAASRRVPAQAKRGACRARTGSLCATWGTRSRYAASWRRPLASSLQAFCCCFVCGDWQ